MPEVTGPEKDEQGYDHTDYVKAALKWQYNWIGLAGAGAFALLSGTGLPLVLAAGLELMYVALVPQSSQFRRLVRSWAYEEEKAQRQKKLAALIRELPQDLTRSYEAILTTCRYIRGNYSRLSSTSQMFMHQIEDQLKGLPQAYLSLLHAAHMHREYLRTTDSATIQKEMDQLQKSLDSDKPKVREINCKRIEILTKRMEKFGNIRENLQVIEAQCEAMEDVLNLIRDQSVTMRDPQQISDQLETLVKDVEQTQNDVKEIESIFELAGPATLQPSFMEPGRTGWEQGRKSGERTR